MTAIYPTVYRTYDRLNENGQQRNYLFNNFICIYGTKSKYQYSTGIDVNKEKIQKNIGIYHRIV